MASLFSLVFWYSPNKHVIIEKNSVEQTGFLKKYKLSIVTNSSNGGSFADSKIKNTFGNIFLIFFIKSIPSSPSFRIQSIMQIIGSIAPDDLSFFFNMLIFFLASSNNTASLFSANKAPFSPINKLLLFSFGVGDFKFHAKTFTEGKSGAQFCCLLGKLS